MAFAIEDAGRVFAVFADEHPSNDMLPLKKVLKHNLSLTNFTASDFNTLASIKPIIR